MKTETPASPAPFRAEAPATFSKAERICGKSDIATLMAKGRWGSNACLRYCCLAPNGLPYSRFLVSVPKKLFKRAVKRNLLKRRIREAWRLQKGLLEDVDILFVYNDATVRPFSEIRDAVAAILREISRT